MVLKNILKKPCFSPGALNNDVQYLTDVNLKAAGYSDAMEINNLEDRLEENGFKPEALYGDAGFVNGTSILEAAD